MQATREILMETAKDVFENLVFMSQQPDTTEGPGIPMEVRAAVRFSGPFSGTLSIDVPKQILTELVANMMGMDEIPTLEQGFDALGELANVICGNVISKIAGPERMFDLDVPRVLPIQEMIKPGLPGDIITSRLVLEKGCAELTLCFDPGAAAT
jgi:CheY-specific phosphatase CheX